MRIHADRVQRRDVFALDVDDRAPLAELRAELLILGESLAQPVEAFGHGLLRRLRERLRADIDLDAGDDALIGEQLHERRAVGGLLADGLVVEDDAADVLADPRRAEEKLAVRAAIVLGVLDADGVEPALDGAGALVRGKDPFA